MMGAMMQMDGQGVAQTAEQERSKVAGSSPATPATHQHEEDSMKSIRIVSKGSELSAKWAELAQREVN